MPESDDDPHIFVETRQYRRDFNRLNTATTTVCQFYNAMLEIHSDRVNPGSPWAHRAANALQPPDAGTYS